MKLSCGCLNIQIHTEGNPTSKNADPIPDFIGSTFNSIVDLHKAIPSLVLTKTVNQFKVVACLVCFLNVYCYTAENTNTLIVNNLALRDKAIDQLKLHADYSSIFQIKIPYNEFNSETGTGFCICISF
ncbi:hypothetical protein BC833DRAFT_588654 [Globomyces pollinis-pini]|nr:hypothetical protein BC833DRAFT_588654 [Globomyces pollinis-pini]